MLSWEYPPLVVGGLGRHVEALAHELAAAGHEVQVVTRGEKDEIVDEVIAGVRVRRAAADPIAIDFTTESLLAWSQATEHALIRAALPLLRKARPDVVHAHDWLVAQSAITIAAGVRRCADRHDPRHRSRAAPGLAAQTAQPRDSLGRALAGAIGRRR